MCVCVSHTHRGRKRIHTEIYFKELAHTIVGAGKFEICSTDYWAGNSDLGVDIAVLESKICKADQQARNTGKISKYNLEAQFLLSWEICFCL